MQALHIGNHWRGRITPPFGFFGGDMELKDIIGDIEIDEHCEYCKRTIKIIEKRQIRKDERIVLTPDYNAHGILTHFHIDIINRSMIR